MTDHENDEEQDGGQAGGQGHGHGLAPLEAASAGARYRRPLLAAFVLTVAFVAVEVAAGVWSGSLALLSDAGHMLSDAGGLGMSLAAISLAAHGSSSSHRTYGWYRVEILASLVNTVLLFAVAAYVVWEAVDRIGAEPQVASTPMLVVALVGLGVNLVCFALLRHGARESLNLRGAYLEVVADAVGSVGVLVAALVIALTGWQAADTVVAVGIGLFILPRAYRLGRDSLRILVESAPAHVDVEQVANDLRELPDVVDLHDLHVWTITSGMDAVSVHLVVSPGSDTHATLDQARQALETGHRITHATVQIEPSNHQGCHLVQW